MVVSFVCCVWFCLSVCCLFEFAFVLVDFGGLFGNCVLMFLVVALFGVSFGLVFCLICLDLLICV